MTAAPSEICFTVYGTPAPQGSKTAMIVPGKKTGAPKGKRGLRAIVVEGKGPGRQAVVRWRQAVAAAASEYLARHRHPVLEGAVYLELHFWFLRPKSTPMWKVWMDVSPDLSKLTRATEEELAGILVRNDAQFAWSQNTKRYTDTGPSRCDFVLRALTDNRPPPRAPKRSREQDTPALL